MSSFWIAPFFAGLIGTTVLTLLVCIPRWLGIKGADMVRGLGALSVRDRDSDQGFISGLAMHYALGIVFAWLYLVGFQAFGFSFSALTGALVGTFHGGLAMFVVEMIILERRPTEPPRSPSEGAPMSVSNQARVAALAQLIGHIFYGAIVAGIYQLFVTHPR